jgi:predicted nuclease of restriction endonuclease-like (RecB) superfamily
MKNFYLLYSPVLQITPQSGEQMAITPQVGEQIFSVPWGHHKLLIDKCKGQPEKAIFYVQQTIANGWSRDMLLNMFSTDLYERHSKAITNFTKTLPDEQSDLARDITRDPYSFTFTGLREPFNERKLKDALIANIEKFLIELGTGFAYMGREVRLQIGETEQFLDMLFYNTRLHCYVVVEVKTTDFEAAHIGQLGTYVVAVDHILKTESDNKTIGLLICKTKDNIFAQYALEATNQPLGISEYELQKLYPTQIEGTMPSIEEIENELNNTK